jgi:hypothetical protein
MRVDQLSGVEYGTVDDGSDDEIDALIGCAVLTHAECIVPTGHQCDRGLLLTVDTLTAGVHHRVITTVLRLLLQRQWSSKSALPQSCDCSVGATCLPGHALVGCVVPTHAECIVPTGRHCDGGLLSSY